MQLKVGKTHRGALPRRPHRANNKRIVPFRKGAVRVEPPPQLVAAVEGAITAEKDNGILAGIVRFFERTPGHATYSLSSYPGNHIELEATGKSGAVRINVYTRGRLYRMTCHRYDNKSFKHTATALLDFLNSHFKDIVSFKSKKQPAAAA